MRLIDADVLFDEAFKVWGTETDAGETNLFMEMINNAPTITPPPNDPLTLEELRKMDGLPVWISPSADGRKIPKRWMLMVDFLPQNRIYLFMPSSGIAQGYRASTYGNVWLAYRRRPEEDGNGERFPGAPAEAEGTNEGKQRSRF